MAVWIRGKRRFDTKKATLVARYQEYRLYKTKRGNFFSVIQRYPWDDLPYKEVDLLSPEDAEKFYLWVAERGGRIAPYEKVFPGKHLEDV
jgi:hypothetical protein